MVDQHGDLGFGGDRVEDFEEAGVVEFDGDDLEQWSGGFDSAESWWPADGPGLGPFGLSGDEQLGLSFGSSTGLKRESGGGQQGGQRGASRESRSVGSERHDLFGGWSESSEIQGQGIGEFQ